MICYRCGNQIEEDSAFCRFCGASLDLVKEAPKSEKHPEAEEITIEQPTIVSGPSEVKEALNSYDSPAAEKRITYSYYSAPQTATAAIATATGTKKPQVAA